MVTKPVMEDMLNEAAKAIAAAGLGDREAAVIQFAAACMIMQGLKDVASALHRLGTNDAGTQMGAMEMLASELKEGLAQVASALESIAQKE